jgi:hypothetical protein
LSSFWKWAFDLNRSRLLRFLLAVFFVDGDSLEQFHARVQFAGLAQPDISQALRELCSGLRSFADLKDTAKDFVLLLEQKVDSKLLRELAPVSIRLQNGRQTKIRYVGDKPPWIASRLQDFFGMRDTPRVGADRPSLVYTCSLRINGLSRPRPILPDSGETLSIGATRTDAPIS